MIATVNTDLTWDGKPAKVIANGSEKQIKQLLKDMTGAVDVEIREVNSWDEEDDEN